jgi:tetratricopeptide (TPR) repeat protein
MEIRLKHVAGLFLVCALGLSPWTFSQETPKAPVPSKEQQKRLEVMKSKGPEASMTVLHVVLAGRPFDRVSEVVGLLLERKGLRNIEIGPNPCTPPANIAMDKLAEAVAEFVKKNPIKTEYALYAEYNGNPQTGLSEVRAVVVDKTGGVVWTDRQGEQDDAMKRLQQKEPMTLSVLLAERLSPELGLNEETAKAAKPGKMASLMEERSGLPPESERAALPQRQKELREARKNLTLTVFPAQIGDTTNSASSTLLAKMITDAGLCKAVPAKQSPLLKVRRDPSQMKMLWDLARAFREYCKKNPAGSDYALFSACAFNPERWEQGYVHFVVCDRNGEWVIVDMQFSDLPDYQNIKPTSIEGCSKLVVRRLEAFLKFSIADDMRETIRTSGIDAAVVRFNELRAKKEEYNLSEEEINGLGYEYVWAKKFKEAIEVFKLNVGAFPESFNAYDSLGEAYAAAGEKELAIKSYEKSLQLNPKSQSGIDALKKLKAQ